MKVNVGIYETPQPPSSGETEKKFHERIQSKGINSGQIKAVFTK